MKKIVIPALIILISNLIFAGNPYKGAKAVVTSEFIFGKQDVPFPSCHASTIAETSDGLIAAWFGGTEERNPDVGIWSSRYLNGKWTIPVEVANGVQSKEKRYPTWNPVLYNSGSQLLLFYKVGPNCSDCWGEYKSSADNGRSWSKATRLPKGIWGPIKNKPVMLENRALLCPSSTEYDGWQAHMETTSDLGLHWNRTESLNDGKSISVIQPTILVHPDGKIQILCRSKSKVIFTSWSADSGKTWSRFEPTSLPNPNSGIDAVTLKDGMNLLVYNHFDSTHDWRSRNILNVAISPDGVNWNGGVLLEYDPDFNTEYSYPAVIQTRDGLVHITYTWNRKSIKHVVINPALIKTKPIINGLWPEE